MRQFLLLVVNYCECAHPRRSHLVTYAKAGAGNRLTNAGSCAHCSCNGFRMFAFGPIRYWRCWRLFIFYANQERCELLCSKLPVYEPYVHGIAMQDAINQIGRRGNPYLPHLQA